MATVTKAPYKIPKHKYWLTIEDKYLVDYSEEMQKKLDNETCTHGYCRVCSKPPHLHRGMKFCGQQDSSLPIELETWYDTADK